MAENLIQKFVELHSQTEQLLNEEKLPEAKQKYLELVEAYHSIDKSQLESFHKELAYNQVTSTFKRINETRERIKIPYQLIAAAILVIAFSFVIFLKPSIVGLAGLETIGRYPVDVTFTESKLYPVTLPDRPLSLAVSGEYLGAVKLYFKQGEKLELIFDSEKLPESTDTFIDICAETCEVNAKSNAIELFAAIEEGSWLKLTEISYKMQRTDNTGPTWTGKTRIFTMPIGTPTTLDLNEYFTDAEGDELVFLSTTQTGLDVIVQNSEVTITPKQTGKFLLTFIASDLREVTRVPVTVEVN